MSTGSNRRLTIRRFRYVKYRDRCKPLYVHTIGSQTYCKEGGWTLLMKIDGAKQTFHYDSPLWTSNSSFNENNVNFDQNEAKLASFWTLPFKEILVGMKTGHEINYVSLPKNAKSLRDVLRHNTYHQTSIGRSTWKSLVPGSSLQPYCNTVSKLTMPG